MVTSLAVTAGSGATMTTAPLVSYMFTGTLWGRMVAWAAAVASTTSSCVGRSFAMSEIYPRDTPHAFGHDGDRGRRPNVSGVSPTVVVPGLPLVGTGTHACRH